MNTLNGQIDGYLEYCRRQKKLDEKTLKAYRIDLGQFVDQFPETDAEDITASALEKYVASLHQSYKPKTVKRKIASLKAFFRYLEYRNVIAQTPFYRLQIRFREPVTLPKTIPLGTVEAFLATVYRQYGSAETAYQKKNALRDAAVAELLFATGMRISELCNLKLGDISLRDRIVLIFGKGSKERRLQIANDDVIQILETYQGAYMAEMKNCGYFFVNQSGRRLSDQAVRRMIVKYSAMAGIDLHITPHMFRHTFATSLLEEDVDIRYIQEMLGHSSINITQIYTHVTMAKQRDILATKHPRKNFHFER